MSYVFEAMVVAGLVGSGFKVNQQAIVPILVEQNRKVVLEFDRFGGLRDFGIGFVGR